MEFYLENLRPRRDEKFPLSTTERFSGDIIVNCEACGTRGILPKQIAGKQEVEILIQDVAYLEDIEQAVSVLLAGRRFQDAVRSAGLTGIAFYPPIGYVIGTKKKGAEEVVRQCHDVLQFQAVHVTGRGGSISHTSGVKLVKSCDVCGWREWTQPENGILIDDSQWDGSDFFYVDEWGSMLMSERAVRLLEAVDLSNFGAMPASQYHPDRPYGVKKGETPRILSKQERKRLRREAEVNGASRHGS